MRRILVLLCATLLVTIHGPAQMFKYLDTQNGLSSRRVLSIEKDKKGYMWFLTHEGVDKYNGKQYVHYKLQDGDKIIQQFPNLNVLATDNKGDMWVLGKDGRIFHYNSLKDQYDLAFKFSEAVPSDKRLPLTFTKLDKNDKIWLCTKTVQYIYETKSKKFYHLDSSIKEEITCISQIDDIHYYIGTTRNIYKATLKGNILEARRDSLLENFHVVHHLYFHSPTQTLLIGTLMDGFYLYNPQKQTIENIGNMDDVNINAVIPYHKSEKELLLATDGNGVYKLNIVTKELTQLLSTNHHYSNKMNGDIIKDIYEDEENRLWMAIYPISITVCSNKYPSYEFLKHSQENPNSLVNNQITYVLEDSDGDIWFATSNGVCCYHSKTKKWSSLLSSYQNDTKRQNYVYISLCEATPGTILVGGYSSGLYRIDKKDMIPHYISPQTLGYTHIRPDKYIRSIYRDEENYIWAGGYYNLKRLHPITYALEHYPMEYPITYITSKNKDELWIGTTNGLYTFDKKQKKILHSNLSPEISNINTIYQEGNNTTYIGTSGNGLWIYNNQTQELKNFQTSNSALICNNIYCILPGNNKDELIISTENELVCFNLKEEIFLNWTEEQGLFATKFNTASGIRTKNGVTIFGSGSGAVILRDSIELPRIFDSKMVFTDFNIHYQKVLPSQDNSPLKKIIDETEKITLSHDQNIFSLNVSSINYDCPSRILYSWKLEGFYDEWTKPSKNNLIRYTNINPGNYTLRIRAILLDDGHTLEERAIQITINPPFSKSIWALMLYITIVCLIIFAIIRFIWMRRDSNLSKEKIQFFIATAHDIRTPLTLIKAPLSDISRNEKLSEQGEANLQMAIRSTDKMSELATRLIDFQKEELYTSEINVSRYNINSYIEGLLEQFKPYAEKKEICMTLERNIDKLEVWIDHNKLDSIIHNLISNALKYTPNGGEIKIRINHNRTHWFLKISDTGIGISSADQKKMFKHLFRGDNAVNLQITGTGIGMLQTYKLVKRHLGKINVSSKENAGTTFRLRFPIDHKRYRHQENIFEGNTQELPVIQESSFKQSASSIRRHTDNPNNINLLIVEDNSDLRQFLYQSLSQYYNITEASNGQEAIDLVREKHPDLILSDIMMPVMRGDELCRVLKSNVETSHIPIILLTALNDKDSIIHGLKIQADNYIAKPFDIEILKASIDNVLANKELVRQQFAQLNYHMDETIQKEIPGIDLDQEFLIKVTELIKSHLDNEFNVDTLCGKLHMSRSSLYNKIKALTGHSPSEFIRQVRLTEATLLLKSKKYTIAEISDMLGFGDPKYFTDIFKKHYGITPSAYMKQEKK